jgi:hypothetical protein
VFLDGLPPESLTKTAIRDGMTVEQWQSLPSSKAWGPWSHTDHLLAVNADRLALLQWTLVAVNSEKNKAGKPPAPIPRPGVGDGPLGAVAEQERRDVVRAVAVLKARERAHGRAPSDAEIEAVMDELIGGDG